MKRILNKLFSKLVLGGLIIILQFSWFVYLLYSATVYSSMVDALFKIASIVLALFVSSRDMRSTYKLPGFSDTGTSSVRNSGILSIWTSGTDKTDPYEDGRGQQQDTGIQFSF